MDQLSNDNAFFVVAVLFLCGGAAALSALWLLGSRPPATPAPVARLALRSTTLVLLLGPVQFAMALLLLWAQGRAAADDLGLAVPAVITAICGVGGLYAWRRRQPERLQEPAGEAV